MSEDTSESDDEQQRKAWLTRLSEEFIKLEKLLPLQVLPSDSEYPSWLENIVRQLFSVLLPSVRLKDAQFVVTPRRMGSLIGHSVGIGAWLIDYFENLKRAETALENMFNRYTKADWKRFEETLRSFERFLIAARRFAKMSLCSCVDQSYEDMRDFLRGYADGMAGKPKSLQISGIGNPNFEIYLNMIFFHREIKHLNSVRELHQLLVKIIGPYRVGDQKRIEKTCQRIGLNFRKPGRPTKKK